MRNLGGGNYLTDDENAAAAVYLKPDRQQQSYGSVERSQLQN